MRRRLIKRVVAIAVVFPSFALAWGGDGHEIAALIAEERLFPNQSRHSRVARRRRCANKSTVQATAVKAGSGTSALSAGADNGGKLKLLPSSVKSSVLVVPS